MSLDPTLPRPGEHYARWQLPSILERRKLPPYRHMPPQQGQIG